MAGLCKHQQPQEPQGLLSQWTPTFILVHGPEMYRLGWKLRKPEQLHVLTYVPVHLCLSSVAAADLGPALGGGGGLGLGADPDRDLLLLSREPILRPPPQPSAPASGTRR